MKRWIMSLAVFVMATSSVPAAETAPPNIVVILADDLGFSDLGCYGSEIATPNLDRLAANGLRFTQFYNTARCWPTRSGLMTGYYPQQIRMDPPRGKLPEWTRTLPQWLKASGYRCYHSGKWHVMGASNPRADAGFDRSYEIEGGQNNYFKASDVIEDGRRLSEQPGFYVTIGAADHAIRCLREHAEKYSGQPFFEYLAFTAPHFPLHALPEDIARYKDRYLNGWDQVREERWQNLRRIGIVTCELSPLETAFTPRYFKPQVLQTLGPGEIQHPLPWAHLTDEQKQFQATNGSVIRDYVFFEHEGNRALRMGNDKLVSAREDKNAWELYDLATDRGEQRNLAAAQPERVREMAARWHELRKQFARDAGDAE